MRELFEGVLKTIGNTPLVEIRKLNPNKNVKIYAKLESFNPGGSVKDRPALYMIERAEERGELTHDRIILEATSGNTGIGLAMVAAAKGYRLCLTLSESASEERKKILKALGAELRFTPAALGTDGAIEEAYSIMRENPDKYFLVDQFNNEDNIAAHYHGTAVEIWQQTGGKVTLLVATLGTSGTAMGCARRLKEYNPDIRIVGVEPYMGHKIQGLKNMKESYRPGIFDKSRLDEKVNILDEDAYEMARRLLREEGIFAGMSCGAAMHVAVEKAKELKEGLIVVILPDSAERYLSTELFADKEKSTLRFLQRSHQAEGVLSAHPCRGGPDDVLRPLDPPRAAPRQLPALCRLGPDRPVSWVQGLQDQTHDQHRRSHGQDDCRSRAGGARARRVHEEGLRRISPGDREAPDPQRRFLSERAGKRGSHAGPRGETRREGLRLRKAPLRLLRHLQARGLRQALQRGSRQGEVRQDPGARRVREGQPR